MGGQLLGRGKLALLADAAEKRHLDLTTIEVARKVEDMHLQRDLLAAKGGARADVHHAQSPRRLVAYLDPHGIDARGGHETARVGELDIGRGETELAALLESGHHASAHHVGMAQAARGRLHLARRHMAPTDRGTDVDALQFEDGVLHHLHPHLAAIGHIVGEALGAVVAEAVVVADEEFGHVEPLQQQVVHKLAGGEPRQGRVEMDHGHHVHARSLQEIEFLLQRGEQAGLIVGMEHLAGMLVEGDDHRLAALLPRGLHHMGDEKLMAPVYAVEEADSGHARGQVGRALLLKIDGSQCFAFLFYLL